MSQPDQPPELPPLEVKWIHHYCHHCNNMVRINTSGFEAQSVLSREQAIAQRLKQISVYDETESEGITSKEIDKLIAEMEKK